MCVCVYAYDDCRSKNSVSAKPKHHRRAIHVPKHTDSDSKVDPERWLPLKERSYYRKGRKPTKGGVKAQVFATGGLSATGDGKGLRAVPPPTEEGGAQKYELLHRPSFYSGNPRKRKRCLTLSSPCWALLYFILLF
jgi:hypothetical protein